MRLFFALPLPEGTRRALAALRADVGKARWVRPEQLHVTMRFLGEVDEERAVGLVERVERVRASWPAVRVAVRGLGLFGSPERPRVLWAALDPAGEVRRIAADLEACVRDVGLPPEERPFTAHVTLARLVRPDRRALRELLDRHVGFETAPFDVPALVLYRSTLTSAGAVHEARWSFALGA